MKKTKGNLGGAGIEKRTEFKCRAGYKIIMYLLLFLAIGASISSGIAFIWILWSRIRQILHILLMEHPKTVRFLQVTKLLEFTVQSKSICSFTKRMNSSMEIYPLKINTLALSHSMLFFLRYIRMVISFIKVL
ncbi:unnamed protein product [Moneuplotes crassus]|uniref:Uncharacterized protein n=1 Tax=Euplotes crassus TaxID=5936 RepID=A0AAD1UH72_EUPCR|nr:unnamed protein product [Moneuplotes crassus]